jgi:hypothetical protein
VVGPYGPPLLPLDPALESWSQLKDRHAGAECLLIGNGPSLNKVDWSFLDVAQLPVVMGANKIYLGFDRFNLRLNYMACTNRRILTRNQSLGAFESLVPAGVVKFFRSDRWVRDSAFNAAHNVVPINSISTCSPSTCRYAKVHPDGGLDALGHKRVNYVNDSSLCTNACRNCFCDPSVAYVEGNTVTYAALQILYFMGCQRVYLIGVDHSFIQDGAANSAQQLDGADPNHFDGAYFGGGQTWDLADLSSSEAHYRLAKERFEADGREVVDITVDGHLHVCAYHKATSNAHDSASDSPRLARTDSQKGRLQGAVPTRRRPRPPPVAGGSGDVATHTSLSPLRLPSQPQAEPA